MKPRTVYRLRYALRLVASVFVLCSPCACQREFAPVEAAQSPAADAANAAAPPATDPGMTAAAPADPIGLPPAPSVVDRPTPSVGVSSADASATGPDTPILRAVRTGAHPGFDRLVFEFDGTGLPAWDIEYVDRPVRDCGSGAPVPVAGDAWLQVRFHGAAAHTPQGQATSGPARRTLGLPNLREVVRLCDFEAEVTWVAGVAMPTAYTPRVLGQPARLVVDIAH